MRSIPIPVSWVFAATLVACSAASAAAQQGWNEPRALDLVNRARLARSAVVVDDSMRTYQADARGYVYFFLDRAGSEETNLVKTDQIALEIYWKAPDSTKQRIVGLRDEESLPTNINYHLDHLTVVQDDYDDLIRLGDGDEVAAVIHPAASGALQIYDFRVADSLTIAFPGGAEPVRVYGVEVRPKDFTQPGFVGTVYIDRESAAIVRMNFTFTSASYADDYLDYIRISMDNSLWDGRYWLPYEQRVELRREVPWFDFPAGTVIRGRYEIRNYRFNEQLPQFLFQGGPVSALPESQRRAFPFEEPLHAQVDAEGLGPVPELADLQAEAARIARDQVLSGLGPLRPWVPNATFALRHNRVEGTALGLGVAYRASDATRLRFGIGHAFRRDRPFATLRASRSGSIALGVQADVNRPVDVGPGAVASGALNTLAGVLADRDYLDLYFASGVTVSAAAPPGPSPSTWNADLSWERHRSGGAPAFGRVVRPIHPGSLLRLGVGAGRRLSFGARARARAEIGHIAHDDGDSSTFTTLAGEIDWTRVSIETGVQLGASLSSGWTSSGAPLQSRVLLGGRGTLPGYGFRSFAGDRWLLFQVEGFRQAAAPWVSVGAFGSVGATWLRPGSVPESWEADATGLARYSAGVSARWLWDILRTDLGRGLNGGEWQVQLSVHTRFWPWL